MAGKAKKNRAGGCPRCGTYRIFSASTQLVGGYNADLCDPCRNDWHDFIAAHPTYLQLNTLEDQIQMLFFRTCGDGIDRLAEITPLREQERSVKSDLFVIGEHWTNTPIVRDSEDD